MEERQKCVHFCLDETTAPTAHVKSLKQHLVRTRWDKNIYQPTLHETQHKQNQNRMWMNSVFARTLLNNILHSIKHIPTYCFDFGLLLQMASFVMVFLVQNEGLISEVSKLTKLVCPRERWMIKIHGERFWCGWGNIVQCRYKTNRWKIEY